MYFTLLEVVDKHITYVKTYHVLLCTEDNSRTVFERIIKNVTSII